MIIMNIIIIFIIVIIRDASIAFFPPENVVCLCFLWPDPDADLSNVLGIIRSGRSWSVLFSSVCLSGLKKKKNTHEKGRINVFSEARSL